MSRKRQNISLMAFDILPMSATQRREGVKVAVSLLDEEGKQREWEEVSRRELFGLIEKYNIQYLGTDNPAEIIEEDESLASFCDKLPTYCDFVHVNLTRSGTTVPLKSLLFQYNLISSKKKLSPLKTAKAMIELMYLGVGMILEPFENETLIKVGKPSGSSKGGWSQARYQRQNEEVVAREAKKIKDALERHKLPFDEIINSTKYGAKMARFHVFRFKKEIDTALKNLSFYPANVEIWSPKKQMITHRPLNTVQRPYRAQFYNHLQRLIVGIDPGMTTGVAIANLSGRILSVFSRKNLSKGQLVSEITNFGVPVLICSDVNPVPTFVSKFAATYNAQVHSPNIELSKIDKRHLVNKTDLNKRLNSHERDALAAVLWSYQSLEENFQKIDEEELTQKQKDLAKGLIIRGLSVTDSISSVTLLEQTQKSTMEVEDLSEETMDELRKSNIELLGRISNLLEDLAMGEDIISNLRGHTGRLESENQLIRNRFSRLKKRHHEIKNEQTRKALSNDFVKKRDDQIKRLLAKIEKKDDLLFKQQKRIKELEEILWISLEQGGYPVKILEKFSHEAIEELRDKHGIYDDDIILMLNPTGGGPQTAENLGSHELKFIFTQGKNLPNQAAEHFYEKKIPVLRAEKYNIIITEYLGFINNKNLLLAQQDYEKYVNQREAKEKTQRIFQTIENYQYNRSKELQEMSVNYDDYEPEEDNSEFDKI